MAIKDLVMVKGPNGFDFADELSMERSTVINNGTIVKVDVKSLQNQDRTLKHNRRYWGGLIKFCLPYWQPDDLMVSESEKQLITNFCKMLNKYSNSKTGFDFCEIGDEFLGHVAQNRADKVPEVFTKTKEGLHLWIKDRLHMYDVISTPTGLVKRYQSTDFEHMDEMEFKRFYKRAFNVLWPYVLSTKFHDKEDAQNAIDNMRSYEPYNG